MGMERSISCCGIVCSECQYYPKECAGCPALKGKVFWLQYVEAEVCPIYQCCVEEKKLDHCGQCGKLPCERWKRFEDPNMTAEESAEGEKRQISLLQKLSESGG